MWWSRGKLVYRSLSFKILLLLFSFILIFLFLYFTYFYFFLGLFLHRKKRGLRWATLQLDSSFVLYLFFSLCIYIYILFNRVLIKKGAICQFRNIINIFLLFFIERLVFFFKLTLSFLKIWFRLIIILNRGWFPFSYNFFHFLQRILLRISSLFWYFLLMILYC